MAAGAAFVLCLGAASCGSDDDSTSPTDAATPGSGASADVRAGIVDYTVSAAAAGGFELDRDCIAGLVGQLSDADAAVLAASIEDPTAGGPELSDAGTEVGDQIFDECIVGSDDQALIDEVIDKVLAESGDAVDPECVRANVPKLNDEQLHLLLETETGSTGPETTDQQLQNASIFLLDCVDFGTPTTAP